VNDMSMTIPNVSTPEALESQSRMNASLPGSRREEAYDRVLEAIVFGDLKPGAAVDEKGLAQKFDVGIAGVHDALARLEIEGMVQRQPRIGTKIAPIGVRELHDLYETRIIVEPTCARIAATRADEQDLERLGRCGERFQQIGDSPDLRELVSVDQAFHRIVAAATKNQYLERQVTVLSNNALRFWCANAPKLTEGAMREDILDHMKVVAAIKGRDPGAAEDAMRHLLSEFPGFTDFYKSNWR
jgi:GntR family transcriptional regulator, rspAB operon transcriptional repressor